MTTSIVWIRNDLRLGDNIALKEAVNHLREEDELLLLFHIHPELVRDFDLQQDYFFQTVKVFNETSGPLHFIYGEEEEAFHSLFEVVTDAGDIYFNKAETGFGKKRDERVLALLEDKGIRVHTYIDHPLHGAEEVTKKDGGLYQVFSPYFKQWQKLPKPGMQQVDRDKLSRHLTDRTEEFSSGGEKYNQLTKKPLRDWQEVGEEAALQRLAAFLDEPVYYYDEDRDIPSKDGTSLMSRYLRTGAISPRTVYHRVMQDTDGRKRQDGVESFIRELAFRDFYHMVYYNHPEAGDQELTEKFRGIPWNEDEEIFERWKRGETGFPFIDAAMKQLNETGWMHNRARMAVASFLTKDLLIDWRKGERYFHQKLADYEAASNIGGWQWAASTGTDAVPYFRVFNPVRQSERFDPHGEYIKAWIPALADVPKTYIHEPHKMPGEEQKKAGCIIGEDYPEPMVDHKRMRERAIEVYKQRKD
ncbi:cryptochrome/photolyase family protein [Salimicrobium flavidum]|uniref:Deoxyribodipyrimidine photo-lyase n=1 Tax=Salimicrobium flavidum TaxID=570947 RepID=A0A1N7IUV4_9BACI|nr:deoxyribodipyrimidine photo-lyase [Salimicrobium flavidum]SIS40868.1 deoxyribodipyrimidine photo-lyase [Salimicrobium flavidum]